MFDFYSVQFRLVPTVDVLFSLQFLCFSLALVFVFVIDMGGFAGVSEQDVTQYNKANNYRQPQSHRHLSPSKHMHQSLVSLTALTRLTEPTKTIFFLFSFVGTNIILVSFISVNVFPANTDQTLTTSTWFLCGILFLYLYNTADRQRKERGGKTCSRAPRVFNH